MSSKLVPTEAQKQYYRDQLNLVMIRDKIAQEITFKGKDHPDVKALMVLHTEIQAKVDRQPQAQGKAESAMVANRRRLMRANRLLL